MISIAIIIGFLLAIRLCINDLYQSGSAQGVVDSSLLAANNTWTGTNTFAPSTTTGGATSLTLTAPTRTAIPTTAECTELLITLGTQTWATGTVATQRFIHITAPTIAFAGASTATLASTVTIDGAPAQGTNATITTAWALNVVAGGVNLGGAVTHGGATTLNGAVTLAPSVTTGGTTSWTLTAPTRSAIPTTAECTESLITLGTQTWAAGTVATQRFIHITAPTVAFASASTMTSTATLTIDGAPIQGTNATLTKTMALNVVAGLVNIGGTLAVTGACTLDSGASGSSFGGNLGVGTAAVANAGIALSGQTLSGSTNQVGIQSAATYGSGATTSGYAVSGQVTTQAASFTMVSAYAFRAFNATIGSGSAITTQYGYYCPALSGAGTNYAFYSAGAGKVQFSDATTIAPVVITTGTRRAFVITGASDTTITSATEQIDVYLNLSRTVQWATSTPATQRAFLIDPPTYSCNTVSQTITTSATVAISGPPSAGSNVTITTPLALWVQSGNVLFAGNCTVTASGIFNGANGIACNQGTNNAGLRSILSLAPANGTLVTSGSENSQVIFSAHTQQWTTTVPTTQREWRIAGPTYSCDTAGQTIATAATLAIIAAPAAGTNVTITNSYALWVQAGATLLGGTLSVTGNVGFNGAAPQAQSTGWGTPTGNSITSSMTGSGATLATVGGCLSSLLLYLKSIGLLGA